MRRIFAGLGVATLALAAACGSGKKGSSSGNHDDHSTPTPIVTPVGTAIGPALTKVIGAGGGTLASDDARVTLTVPAGAVSADTTFSVQRYSSGLPNGIGASYVLEPHGVTFAQPLTLTFSVPEAGVSRTGIGALLVAYRDDDGHWRMVDTTRNEAAKALQVTTDHLSPWSPLEGIQLTPSNAHVHEGGTQDLEIVVCTEEINGVFAGRFEEGRGIVYPCGRRPLAALTPEYKIYDWSVNGLVTGDAIHGRIWPSGTNLDVGIYTAPSKKPKPSTVTASVNVGKTEGHPTRLFTPIHIGDPGFYEGNVNLASSGVRSFTGGGQVRLEPRQLPDGTWDDNDQRTKYDVKFTLTIDSGVTLAGHPCSVAQRTVSGTEEYGLTYYKVPARMDWMLIASWDGMCEFSDGQGGTTYLPMRIGLSWLTQCGMRVGLDDGTWGFPLADPNRLQGSYTQDASCPNAAASTQSVTWKFQELDLPGE